MFARFSRSAPFFQRYMGLTGPSCVTLTDTWRFYTSLLITKFDQVHSSEDFVDNRLAAILELVHDACFYGGRCLICWDYCNIERFSSKADRCNVRLYKFLRECTLQIKRQCETESRLTLVALGSNEIQPITGISTFNIDATWVRAH